MLTGVSTRRGKVTDVINGLNKLNISLAKKKINLRKRKRITESEDNQILMRKED